MAINKLLLLSNYNKTSVYLSQLGLGLCLKFIKSPCFYSLDHFHAEDQLLRPNCHTVAELTLSRNFKPFSRNCSGENLMSEDKSTAESLTKKMKLEDSLVWIDLEMTGLDVDKEEIMEAAVIVTDSNLETIKEGPDLVLKVEDKILNNMGDWCKEHHGESGLTAGCRKSTISLAMAEEQILAFVTQYTEKGVAPLAGNSIHADKRFLDKYMPRLMKHLHYRIVDVSTVKELCRRWYPEEFEGAPKKKGTHRALEDIKESIEELKYYRSKVFK